MRNRVGVTMGEETRDEAPSPTSSRLEWMMWQTFRFPVCWEHLLNC